MYHYLALIYFCHLLRSIAITPQEQCSALDGYGYNYCAETGIYYCCGLNNDGYGCGQEATCASNMWLQHCVCNNGELRPETRDFLYSRSDLVVDDSADGTCNHFVVDLDQDGDLDVLSSNYDEGFYWYRNDGSYDFSKIAIDTVMVNPRAVVSTDVDEDGDNDIFAVSQGDDTFAWFENNGAQSFTKHTLSTTTANFDTPKQIIPSDIDQDGDIDFLAACYVSDSVVMYRNDGSQSFTEVNLGGSHDGAHSIFVADIDGDGDYDVAVASQHSSFGWYENDGSSSFTFHTVSSSNTRFVIVHDLDQDSDLDFLTADITSYSWYQNDGSQSFSQYTIGSGYSRVVQISVADIDDDGDLDIIGADEEGSKLMLFENDGSQSFTEHVLDSDSGRPHHTSIVDINGDGLLDVLVSEYINDKMKIYENRKAVDTVKLFSNGEFGSMDLGKTVIDSKINGPGDVFMRRCPDCDSGYKVIIYERLTPVRISMRYNMIVVWSNYFNVLNVDFRLYGSISDYRDGSNAWSYCNYNDFNYIGFPRDCGPTEDTKVVHQWNTLGSSSHAKFVSFHSYNTLYSSIISGSTQTIASSIDQITSLQAADFNGDGHIDLVSGDYNDGVLHWYEHSESGSFTQRVISSEESYIYSIDVADFNGKLDVLNVSLCTAISIVST